MFRRRKERAIPGLNTSSLPDLIFTVLFFFMIVTHMRKVTLKVQYRIPQGIELTRMTKKSTVSYIYIGKPAFGEKTLPADRFFIQLNDKIVSPSDIEHYLRAERNRMLPEDVQQMTAVIRADKDTPMHLITTVKLALRNAGILNINYSAVQENLK